MRPSCSQGNIIDYAARVGWSGLVGTFYAGRWTMFLDMLLNSTATGTQPDWDSYYADILAFSRAWDANDTQAFPDTPSGGDPTQLAAGVLSKWAAGSESDYTAYPNTDAGLPAPAAFFQAGGANEAAVSPDCPFVAHGDGTSLQTCEAGCAQDAVCTTINW